jgi:hypothetical protein
VKKIKSPLATFQNSNIYVPKKIAKCGSVLKYNILHYKMVFADSKRPGSRFQFQG